MTGSTERDMLAVWMQSIDGRLAAIEGRLHDVACSSAANRARLSTWASAAALVISLVALLVCFI